MITNNNSVQLVTIIIDKDDTDLLWQIYSSTNIKQANFAVTLYNVKEGSISCNLYKNYPSYDSGKITVTLQYNYAKSASSKRYVTDLEEGLTEEDFLAKIQELATISFNFQEFLLTQFGKYFIFEVQDESSDVTYEENQNDDLVTVLTFETKDVTILYNVYADSDSNISSYNTRVFTSDDGKKELLLTIDEFFDNDTKNAKASVYLQFNNKDGGEPVYFGEKKENGIDKGYISSTFMNAVCRLLGGTEILKWTKENLDKYIVFRYGNISWPIKK